MIYYLLESEKNDWATYDLHIFLQFFLNNNYYIINHNIAILFYLCY